MTAGHCHHPQLHVSMRKLTNPGSLQTGLFVTVTFLGQDWSQLGRVDGGKGGCRLLVRRRACGALRVALLANCRCMTDWKLRGKYGRGPAVLVAARCCGVSHDCNYPAQGTIALPRLTLSFQGILQVSITPRIAALEAFRHPFICPHRPCTQHRLIWLTACSMNQACLIPTARRAQHSPAKTRSIACSFESRC